VADQPAIVSAPWLRDHLHDPQVVVVDCRFDLMQPDRGRKQYLSGHIPGAHYLDLNRDLSGPVQRHGGRHPLPDPSVLAQKLGKMGVRSAIPDSPHRPPTLVVVYDDSRFAFAARLWWLLRYLSHDAVALLDGGFGQWQALGFPVIQRLPQLHQSTPFLARLRPELSVDVTAVKAQVRNPGVILVDSRDGDRYRGEREPIDPLAGHIPGAVNYPWQEVSHKQGHLRSLVEQRARWENLMTAGELIVYCGSGVTACVNLYSLALVGIATGRLYPGGWSDWCSYLQD